MTPIRFILTIISSLLAICTVSCQTSNGQYLREKWSGNKRVFNSIVSHDYPLDSCWKYVICEVKKGYKPNKNSKCGALYYIHYYPVSKAYCNHDFWIDFVPVLWIKGEAYIYSVSNKPTNEKLFADFENASKDCLQPTELDSIKKLFFIGLRSYNVHGDGRW